MKKYTVEIINYNKHGRYASTHRMLTVVTVEANNKKEASEIALQSLIGKKAADFGKYGFPIDIEHAPEGYKSEFGGWAMTCKAAQEHLINEFDISRKDIITKITINQ